MDVGMLKRGNKYIGSFVKRGVKLDDRTRVWYRDRR